MNDCEKGIDVNGLISAITVYGLSKISLTLSNG